MGALVVVDVVVVASVVLVVLVIVEEVEEACIVVEAMAAGTVVSVACSVAGSFMTEESSNHSVGALSWGVVVCTIMRVAEHATIPIRRRNRTNMLGAAFRRMPF